MTRNQSRDGQDQEISWEDAVARYLEDNPDYFERYPELLAMLSVPHPDAGRAVSLIERQVQVLRDTNQRLSRQLRELVSIARENDVIGTRLQRFALAMIEATGIDEVLDTARDMLRQEFKLDAVAVCLQGGPPAAQRREFIDPDSTPLGALLKAIAANRNRPLTGGRHDGSLMAFMFGDQASEINSTALTRLIGNGMRGVLCLGSGDAHRFHPDMGTMYLAKLGELLMAGIGRHLE